MVQTVPQAFPLMLRRMQRDPIGFFESVAREQGPVARMPMGIADFYLINSPETIQDILVTQGAAFEKFPRIPPAQGLFGNGLLTSEGALHRTQRRLMQPAFHRDRISNYAGIMAECARNACSSWTEGARIDIATTMNRLALDIVSRALFEADTRDRAAEIGECLHEILPALNRLVLPFGEWLVRLPTPANRRYREALRRLDQIIYGLIAERRIHAGNDLIGMLTRGEAGSMDDRQLRDEVMTIFIAGHETTANALVWTWYLLAQHPEWADRAQHDPGVIDLVVPESLRQYPPVWILGRRAIQPYRFDRLDAPAGSVFLVCTYVLHRRPDLYPDADCFRPDRWAGAEHRHRYAFLPFGAGSRLCIGERFADLELRTVLREIGTRWRLELPQGAIVQPQPMLTLRPQGGLTLIARRR